MGHTIKAILIPGSVLVSVIMGGGYGTGREVIEYFSQYGQLGGTLGILLSTLVFAVALSLTFDFARRFQVYDYRGFFKALIGPYWIAFEILYLLLFLLVLGVISAAASDILNNEFGLSNTLNLALLLMTVSFLVLLGRDRIENLLTFWCFGMYGVFVWYIVTIVQSSDLNFADFNFPNEISSNWWQGGVLYPFYNLAIAPVLLFATRGIEKASQSWLAGIVAAIMVMLPAMLFHISYRAGSPQVLTESIPNYWMIEAFGSRLLMVVFIVAFLGTLIETAIGLIHGLIERMAMVLTPNHEEAALTKRFRLGVASVAMMCAVGFSHVGIISLIGKGYSIMAIGFAIVYILPLFTLGIYKMYLMPHKS